MKYFGGRVELLQGDITTLIVDAIVNAASPTLLGGGGVDGAIHRAAGAQLVEECRALEGCVTGEAKITRGYDLPATHVIHTVGPVYRGGDCNEVDLLASSYHRCLEVAQDNGCATVAFPAISTGVYGYPIEDATRVAMREVKWFLEDNEEPKRVIFCCFSNADLEVYLRVATEMYGG